MLRIGKTFSFLILVFAFIRICGADIRMSVSDQSGRMTRHVVAGIPFILSIDVDVAKNITIEPNCELSNGVTVLGRSSSSTLRMVDNNQSYKKKYRYTLRADNTGTVQLGPASIIVDGDRLEAQAIELLVADVDQANVYATPNYVQFKLSKDECFVAENVPFTMQFFSRDLNVSLDSVGWPNKNPNVQFSFEGNPRVSEKVVDGEVYRVVTYSGSVCSYKAGSVTIPAIPCVYSKRNPHSVWGQLNRIWPGSALDQSRVFSKAVALTARALPKELHEPAFVGTRCLVQAAIDRPKVTQNEACLYKLMVHGQGNFDLLQVPELVLPDNLTSYPSSSFIADDGLAKFFEFVIQATMPGSFTIPAQEINFLNTDTGQIESVIGNSLSLEVEPGGQFLDKHSDEGDSLSDSLDSDNSALATTFVPPFNTGDSWFASNRRAMTFARFWLLIFIIFALWLIWLLYALRRQYDRKYPAQAARKRAYKIACKALTKASVESNSSQLHPIFSSFFSARWGIGGLTDDQIEDRLKALMDDNEYKKWITFFEQIQRAAFAAQGSHKELLKQAKEWLQRLQEC
ncbi:hypothetical protein HOL34_00405 [bacterium]|jgi:hypothetical protein|nr:hypothetical protein [bacterium]MBT3903332.1 hypothetical protein [bacterium]MBT4577732.1 hypothetical protein [bacterium]MBT5345510.1 hypothetical protein [bacterium]MBT6131204.1 hypothetical protein [bacterium]